MTGPTKQTDLKAWLRDIERLASDRGFDTARWGDSGGLPLLGFSRKVAGDGPRIYLSAGIHGDEPAGPQAIEALLRRDLLNRQISWTICPLLNPGGALAGTRETAAGIDLNRDYRARRSAEAAAHCAWIDRLAPHDLYLSLHEDWEATGFYLYEINTRGEESLARQILHRVTALIPIEPLTCIDQHTVCAPGYIAHPPEPDEPLNWPEAIYHCKRYPHLSYTFETPSSLPIPTRVEAHITATQTAAEKFRRKR